MSDEAEPAPDDYPEAEFEKVCDLEDEVQAQLLKGELEDRDIPHLVVSHRDTAYDGLFQATQGWGHVEAPPSYRDEIEELLETL